MTCELVASATIRSTDRRRHLATSAASKNAKTGDEIASGLYHAIEQKRTRQVLLTTAGQHPPFGIGTRLQLRSQAANAATASLTCCSSDSESGGTGNRHSPTLRPVNSLAALATGLNGKVHNRRLIGRSFFQRAAASP
jgi:hypothetical protein